MRRHQDRYGRNHNNDHMQRWKQSVPNGCGVYDPDNSRHHQGVDHDVAETDGGTPQEIDETSRCKLPYVPEHLIRIDCTAESPSAGLRALARMAR
jgi:hypothetical protein